MSQINQAKTINLQPDYRKQVYARFQQGAMLRAGAGLFFWAFSFAAYLAGLMGIRNIAGITLCILFLIVVNLPILAILRISSSRRVYAFSTILNTVLEVIGYTAVIYFLGGIRGLFLSPIYAILIAYVGVLAQPWFPFFVAALCGIALSVSVGLEYYGLIPSMDPFFSSPLPGYTQFFILLGLMVILFVIAFITSYMGNQLRKNRRQLRQQYAEMEESARKIEQSEMDLRKTYQELEKKVEERTLELREANDRLRDEIRERKQAEEERGKLEAHLWEVQKFESLGVFAGGIAHDFNNLLMAILGNADLALLSLSPLSPVRHNIEEIAKASQRAADLCSQMLAYSGQGQFLISRYDLSEILRNMAPMLEVLVSKKATLRYSFAEDLPPVKVDATQMRQVIINLITNALDALGDKGGLISVSTGVRECDRAYLSESYLDDNLPEGRYVYLEVSDTGYGMDDETKRKIFDPFFTTKFTGQGLGLAAVLGIVRGHKGVIRFYSEPGKGTTFKILLPALEWTPGERARIIEQRLPQGRGRTVLLIDDDPQVRNVGKEMLVHLGYQVLSAADGREGLEVFRAHSEKIDCVILDLTMPEMDGRETFRELRRLKSDVRVILSSGYDEQNVSRQFDGQGLAGFVHKPYTVERLQAIMNHVLG